MGGGVGVCGGLVFFFLCFFFLARGGGGGGGPPNPTFSQAQEILQFESDFFPLVGSGFKQGRGCLNPVSEQVPSLNVLVWILV